MEAYRWLHRLIHRAKEWAGCEASDERGGPPVIAADVRICYSALRDLVTALFLVPRANWRSLRRDQKYKVMAVHLHALQASHALPQPREFLLGVPVDRGRWRRSGWIRASSSCRNRLGLSLIRPVHQHRRSRSDVQGNGRITPATPLRYQDLTCLRGLVTVFISARVKRSRGLPRCQDCHHRSSDRWIGSYCCRRFRGAARCRFCWLLWLFP